MIETQKELQKLAVIERDLINTARAKESDTNIVIKIRNGVIVWAEADLSQKQRIDFKGIFSA